MDGSPLFRVQGLGSGKEHLNYGALDCIRTTIRIHALFWFGKLGGSFS